MSTMKRMVAMLLCILFLLSMAACGGKSASSETSDADAKPSYEKDKEEKESPKKEDSAKDSSEQVGQTCGKRALVRAGNPV